MPNALIVDDDTDFLSSLAELIKREGFSVATAGSVAEARQQLEKGIPSLIVADLGLPDGSGIDLLRDVEGIAQSDVIIMSGQATVDAAIDALRLGALDFLIKPLDMPRLKTVLAHIMRSRALKEEVDSLRDELRRLGRFGPLIGGSPEMQSVYDLITKVAPTDASVFITGDSGTGKELVAQTVHQLSRRRKQPFLPLNCGAVPATLIESELFGHERGSFTGATQLRRGHFERASGGTLFLDEITEMPIELQVKLLRVLENNALMRVGGEEPITVNVRILTATNRSPEEAVRAGKLREDLLYRLNVFPIALPPLRDRRDDVLLLADHFLQQLNDAEQTSKRFSPTSRERILAHAWPGNVRELKNEVHRAYIMSEDVIELDGLSAGSHEPAAADGGLRSIRIGASLADVERQLILATLEHCAGDKRKAAAILGISLKTLYNRLNVYAAA
ncbi:MAG TPA: sigma-54 dependent transcriptional regulator [Candidatus Limnocylindria bacterium]|nr:sigma-54 dependent transcriptional regulator [Candidatus Limnocylindria bacterium]